ncbi:hypothetical protein P7K49_023716 [Saguinus oedipus]|uniref:Uncharacterized protein n=1 Tax=Saguinus oedipus TaxID=9490 RepID=A0ABQ9UN89_SAGOE|nr:hypothetical protein P7K49_023716 [Saguinus oedipus]
MMASYQSYHIPAPQGAGGLPLARNHRVPVPVLSRTGAPTRITVQLALHGQGWVLPSGCSDTASQPRLSRAASRASATTHALGPLRTNGIFFTPGLPHAPAHLAPSHLYSPGPADLPNCPAATPAASPVEPTQSQPAFVAVQSHLRPRTCALELRPGRPSAGQAPTDGASLYRSSKALRAHRRRSNSLQAVHHPVRMPLSKTRLLMPTAL